MNKGNAYPSTSKYSQQSRLYIEKRIHASIYRNILISTFVTVAMIRLQIQASIFHENDVSIHHLPFLVVLPYEKVKKDIYEYFLQTYHGIVTFFN